MAGQYDHNFKLACHAQTFLLAGGAGNEDFCFPLRLTKQKIDQALLDVGYKENSSTHAHMVAEKLTLLPGICKLTKKNGLQQVMRQNSELLQQPLAMLQLEPHPAGISQAEVLMLIQSQASGSEITTNRAMDESRKLDRSHANHGSQDSNSTRCLGVLLHAYSQWYYQ